MGREPTVNDTIELVRAAGPDVQIQTTPDGTSFFFVGTERMLPFATVVTSDAHDDHSRLDRPGIFRLNVGVSPATFRARVPSREDTEGGAAGEPEDFTVPDRILPHPVYEKMFWLCILNPSPARLPDLTELLREAYDRAATRPSRR